MKPFKNLFFIPIIIFLFSGCIGRNTNQIDVDSTASPEPAPSQVNQSDASFLSPCDLITLSEMETIFMEGPLFLSEENGSCIVKNQWDTRSIWFTVYQGEQALPAMQWYTRHLISGWKDEELSTQIEEIIISEENQSLRTLQESRLIVYEELEYRWERLFTFGDSAYWIIYPRAFTGVFDVVEGEIFYQIGYSGFSAAQIHPVLEDLSGLIFSRLPEDFYVNFEFPIENVENTDGEELIAEVPQIIEITKTSQEIFFGNLCEDESSTIRVFIEKEDLVDNVYLVYRLVSDPETNDNWNTVFMNQNSSQIWEIPVNAETSFSTYQVINGAQVEYSIAIIYGVNSVLRSQTLRDITVLQCRQ